MLLLLLAIPVLEALAVPFVSFTENSDTQKLFKMNDVLEVRAVNRGELVAIGVGLSLSQDGVNSNSNDRSTFRCGFAISRDLGASWSDKVVSRQFHKTGINPAIAIGSRGQVVATCMDLVQKTESRNGRHFVRATGQIVLSRNESSIWSPWESVDGTELESGISDLPSLMFDSKDRLHMSYTRLRPGGTWDVVYMFSDDDGRNWSELLSISGALSRPHQAQGSSMLEGKNGDVLLSFAEYREKSSVYFVRIDPESKSVNLSAVSESGVKTPITRLVRSPNNQDHLILHWYNGHRAGVLKYIESFDGGETWGEAVNYGFGTKASLAIDHSGNVLATWLDQEHAHQYRNLSYDDGQMVSFARGIVPAELTQKAYLGAFETLLCLEDGTVQSFSSEIVNDSGFQALKHRRIEY